MKKNMFPALLLVMALVLVGCGGDVRNVSREIGASEIYSEDEIDGAMDVVVRYFATHYSGCTLTKIAYDEEVSAKAAPEWAEQYEAEEAIVLVSSFDVDSSGGDGSRIPTAPTMDGSGS